MASGGPAFHLARAARERLGLLDVAADERGDLPAADLVSIRRLAARLNEARLNKGRFDESGAPGAPILPGQLAALVLLHELGHLVISRLQAERPGRAIDGALRGLEDALGPAGAAAVLEAFGEAFPPGPGAPPEDPPARLAELVLTRVANENPATEPLRELIDDRPLARLRDWRAAIQVLEATLGPVDEAPPADPFAAGLLAILRAPAAHAPTSLAGQLRYVRRAWVGLLGDAAAALFALTDEALGELAEEEAALARGFGGHAGGVPLEVPRLAGLDDEAERFSPDAAWMPALVLQARSTYVWLDQLSRRHGREIRTLDAIPDEELARLAGWGINGLWLIGVWRRSAASKTIKHRRGNPDALASAYAIDDYVVADDLGGEDALARLRDRALAHGIRLACDMVPNHMGIDSRWLLGRPDWFLSVPEPPYPAYSFDGPDLSPDPGVAIVLEDHYWDGSDAAVVFQRRDRASGETRYVYHGNDGTSLPWNDTAQLNFLDREVREQVIRTIVDVARRFPVIRFDAAMVLARRHIRRLWWPEPGAGGGVPSRGAHAIPQDEFDRRMPVEFWREVVDRVAAEVPDTLLLAEAFWLMEGYFVRTLGMHRVYNSAFMHMLRDEDIAGYRRLIRDTLEFDPEILERYVNFMSNPDEATAVEQFGRGDKHFGTATVLATMPGLPMLGHGHVEGLAEKYGMEFGRAGWDEEADPTMVARHEREIAPLLRERWRFGRAADFRLYDLHRDDGTVDERVLAYSNGRGDSRSVVAYLGVFGDTEGWLRESAAYAVKGPDGSKALSRQPIADALELPPDPGAVVAFRDRRTGLEHLLTVGEVRDRGLRIRLEAYGVAVFDGFRVIPAGTGRWLELAGRIGALGVPSLDEAMAMLELEPLHERVVGSAAHLVEIAAALDPRVMGPPTDGLERAVDAVASVGGLLDEESPSPDAPGRGALARERIARSIELSRTTPAIRPLLLPLESRLELVLAIVLRGGADPGEARERFDRLRLGDPVVKALGFAGLDDEAAREAASRIRAVLGLPLGSAANVRRVGSAPLLRAAHVAASWLEDPAVRDAVGVNRWQGVDWIVQEQWAALVDLWGLLSAAGASSANDRVAAIRLAEELQAVAEEAGYRVDRLHAAAQAPSDQADAGTR